MGQLWALTSYELRQRIRDRSVLIFGLVVPFALMFVLNLTFGGTIGAKLERIDVAVSVPSGDTLATRLVESSLRNDAVDVSVRSVSEQRARALAERGDSTLAVIVPEGFGAALTAGSGPVVTVVQGKANRIESTIVISIVGAVLDQLEAGAVTGDAGVRLGLAPDRVAQAAEQAAKSSDTIVVRQGRAANEQLGTTAALVAGQAGFFLLFTVGVGLLSLIVEREQGTLDRLLSMPLRPRLIVASKALVSYILGVGATAVLLVVGSAVFGVSFGSPVTVAVLIAIAVAAGTSVMFVIARVARTSEQANIAQSVIAVVLGMSGGAFFPIAAGGFVGRILDLNPIAAFIRGLGISAGGGGIGDLGGPVAAMGGFALVCLVISGLIPDRTMLR